MNFPNQKESNNIAALVLIPILALASGCSTDSGTRKSSALDPVNEADYLTAAEVRKDPDRIICRRHKPTGSRISEKICMTARQWQRANEASDRFLDRAHRAPQAGTDQ